MCGKLLGALKCFIIRFYLNDTLELKVSSKRNIFSFLLQYMLIISRGINYKRYSK